MKRLAPLLSMLLIVAVAVLAGVLSQRYAVSFDWTHGNRNSLTAASRRVIHSMHAGPIDFTAYIYPGPDREKVRQQLARYTRASHRVDLQFADPARHPNAVRRLGIGESGAVEVAYQGRHQMVTDYSEASVTNALQRLSVAGQQWLVFVTGHGERNPQSRATAGYSRLATALDAQGMKVRTLNLVAAGAIPDNTAALVIASPQHTLLPGEVNMIRAYVKNGGNLLWADDPGPRYGLVPLAQDLGLHWDHGTIVYPDYQKLGTGSPEMALVANYPDTPITRNLHQISLFPFAGGLGLLAAGAGKHQAWKHEIFLRSPGRSWLETGSLDSGSITYEPDTGDRAGPIDFGIALDRTAASSKKAGKKPRQQRVAVVADSDFMDNGHIGDLGNRTLALSIFQWLAHRDAQISIDVPKAPDAHLQMAPARLRWFWWGYVVILPLAMLALGFGRWWRRRRR